MQSLRLTCPWLPRPRPGAGARHRGFTAIELMVTIAILAVLSALAAPSFTPIMERWRVRQAAEELQSTIYFARSESIKRGGGVTIQAIGKDWNGGWQVTHTANGTTTELQNFSVPANTAFTLKDDAQGAISVDRWGMLSHGTSAGAAVAMDFLITPKGKDQNAAGAARLCISQGGRAQQKKGSDSCST
ncbi:MAG TPA: GspH/FimT family pseudopilin [Alicycliphilus sp.]|nr:GspH/FimT family pseudopilin [Alicycliphilus sp.]